MPVLRSVLSLFFVAIITNRVSQSNMVVDCDWCVCLSILLFASTSCTIDLKLHIWSSHHYDPVWWHFVVLIHPGLIVSFLQYPHCDNVKYKRTTQEDTSRHILLCQCHDTQATSHSHAPVSLLIQQFLSPLHYRYHQSNTVTCLHQRCVGK